MSSEELLATRATLSAFERTLAERLRRREGLAVERHPDEADELRSTLERETAISTLAQATNLLRLVRSALQRLDEGTFGTCLTCGDAISPSRLAALPWALRCVGCEARREQTANRRKPVDTRALAAAFSAAP
jgi:DnaK suppressor protein